VESLVVKSRFWRDRSVLLTGATGLLGGWLARHLLDRGARATAVVRDWVPQSEVVRKGLMERLNVVRGDVTDQVLLERVLGEYEVENVFHLAAQTLVGIANANPVSTLDSNIRGTWCLLEACRRSPRVRAIVIASSDKAYGSQAKLPYAEDMPLQGRHPYDVSKSCADLIAQSYAHTYGLPVAITRCGNFYGGGDLNWNRIVPGTIRSTLRQERPIIRSDGNYIRDYLYVEDGSEAYLLLGQQLSEDPGLRGAAFNFSTETPITVLDLVNKILKTMGSDLQPEIRNETSYEIREQFLSARLARQRLRWQPQFTLDEGLKRTISWYSELLMQ
jgi:CDP-glucose 4,6-dehydratase